MRYFKAVYRRHVDDHPVSVMYHALPVDAVISYPPNEWVSAPDDTPVFICTDLAEAIDHGGNFCEIWECDAEAVSTVIQCLYPDIFADTAAIAAYWNGEAWNEAPLRRLENTAVLNGPYTVAKRVRLTKRLDPADYAGRHWK